jgi:phosphoglucosamine mutase
VLSVLQETGVSLSELNRVIEDVPQVLVNCRVKTRKDLDGLPGYKELIAEIQKKLNKDGRIFVRFSGTEPLIRILVEGPSKSDISAYAAQVAEFLEKHLS